MFPSWTLTDHSNIDVKNVVNYSHLNLIPLTKLFTKSKLIVDTKSQLVIQCVLHDYVLVFKYPSDHILHEDHKTRWKVSQTLASHADILGLRHAERKSWKSLINLCKGGYAETFHDELLSRPRSQNSRHVLGWEICVRVWEGRGKGSSVHVYRTCRRISRYGFCLSGGGVGLESRMTSCYLIKLTGCSSDVFENTSKRKKNFIS